MASRGDFTRQPVNIPCLQQVTKVGPVSNPSENRQAPVRSIPLLFRMAGVFPASRRLRRLNVCGLMPNIIQFS
jgi:hypothetical protein